MSQESGANTAIVTIVAIIAILIVGYMDIQFLGTAENGDSDINIDLPGTSAPRSE